MTSASLAKTTSAECSPASVTEDSPTTRIRAPRSKPSAGSTPRRTGALDAAGCPGRPSAVVAASNHSRPSRPTEAEDVTSAVISTTRPSHRMAASRAGRANPTQAAAAAIVASTTTTKPPWSR
ncbi:hypothetical protein [Microbacterium maritypicum]|uniref:hypothetical protein n=1 Tax=Microbacterium maritypicum TaxID=33918 RepID=UPI00147847D7|nr:hypothetical protein [Microbacterium liquefaciens]